MQILLRSAIWYNQNWRVNVVFAYFKKVLNKWMDLQSIAIDSAAVIELFREAKAVEPRVNSISAVIGDYLCDVLDGYKYVVVDIDMELAPWQHAEIAELAKKTPVMISARGYQIWFKMPCSEAPKKSGKLCKPDGAEVNVDLIAAAHCAALVPSARMRDNGSVHIVHFHPNSTRCRATDVHCLRQPWNLKVEPATVSMDWLQSWLSDILGVVIPRDLLTGVRASRPRSATRGKAESCVPLIPTFPLDVGFDEFLDALKTACDSGDAPRCVCWAFFEQHPHGERWIALAIIVLSFAYSSFYSRRDWEKLMEHAAKILEDFPEDKGTTLDRKAEYLVCETVFEDYYSPRYTSINFIPIPASLCEKCKYRYACNGKSLPLRLVPYSVIKGLGWFIYDNLDIAPYLT